MDQKVEIMKTEPLFTKPERTSPVLLVKSVGKTLPSLAVLVALFLSSTGYAQSPPTTVIFEDDFESNEINETKYQAANPFFEGGQGDIHAEAGDGVMRFVGTTTQQWWSGGTLKIKESFNAAPDAPITISIDRVEEAGQGTASRSALWIFNEDETNYVLFADVRGEGGWRYNRKIGEDGDVPTGGGNNIAAFDGEDFDDGGLHQMSIVADGSTVKLLLDGMEGAEVSFPFSPVVFHFGSYARANNDNADTTWDNLRVEGVQQESNVVFSDDFESNEINETKYQAANPFFEGGQGDIHAEAGDGVMRFVGTTTQQWWSGGTLKIKESFNAAPDAPITISIDRVEEAGQGTASRSALWIFNEDETNYVLFADVRGEGGWRYNRKIGEDGDVPTGGGNNIAAFDGEDFDDGGLHQMSIVADGSTVKLLLDGMEGAEVSFPFSPVVFHFGSYARANNDNADTTWDNLVIESEGSASFLVDTGISVRENALSPPITVRIPQGLNLQRAISLTIVSEDPSIAVPEGGANGRLELTFPAGGENTATFRVAGNSPGGTQFRIESNDVNSANVLAVAVISEPGLLLEENFSGNSIDDSKWQISEQGFGNAEGEFTVEQTEGRLKIDGFPNMPWAGASLKTVDGYLATEDLNLVFEGHRISIDSFDGSARAGVFITNDDRSRYVFFSQLIENEGATSWRVNVNPGSPTGAGTVIDAFSEMTEWNIVYRMKLVADGSNVEVFLDGVSGGKFPFEVSTGIHFEIGAYAQDVDNGVTSWFDSVKIENALPCIQSDDTNVLLTLAQTQELTVTVPRLANDSEDVSVTITSSDSNVAVPVGATDGALTLNFAAGASNSQTVRIHPTGLGTTSLTLSNDASICVGDPIRVEVVSVPEVLLSDDFSGTSFDSARWREDSFSFNNSGAAKPAPDSMISIEDGQLLIHVEVETPAWPGLALFTKQAFSASAAEPLTFEIDRKMVDFVLAAGVSSESRTGIWVRSEDNYVFFVDHTTHDARNFGWRYNRVPGNDDNERTGNGVNIPAFDGGSYDNRMNHRLKMVLNGSTVKLFLDDVFGTEVDFPFSDNLSFGFGSYADDVGPADADGTARGNQTKGFFDNALITGGSTPFTPMPPPSAAAISSFSVQDGNLVIEWSGASLLESNTIDGEYTPIADATPPSTAVPITAGNKFIIAR